MKTKTLLLTLVVCSGLGSCTSDPAKTGGSSEGVPTYMSVTVNFPASQLGARAAGDYIDPNRDGTYEGNDLIKTLDVYLQDAQGNIEHERFVGTDIAIVTGAGGITVSPNTPFVTTSGQKTLYVVLNDTEDQGAGFGPGSAGDLVDTEGLATIEDGKDVIVMTGSNTINVDPDISLLQAAAGSNRQTVDVTRLASRVIVTQSLADMAFDDGYGNTGTLSNLQYSVAQGTKKIYWLEPTGENIYNTYGYSYVPSVNIDPAINTPYVGDQYASLYYDYSDLSTPSAIPVQPAAADGYKSLPGKFLYENIHKYGADPATTGYRKGNTAYVLVKATLTPDAAAIADGGTLTNGTFYVGAADGKIYSSKEAAQEAVENQKVDTYLRGKMLYFAWLNPDSVTEPLNSPVLRNNIYHINVRSISLLGQTWNPLYPEDPDTANPQNPDPKPSPDEPTNPIDPYDPLSTEDTYMTIDATVLAWITNSYDIDF